MDDRSEIPASDIEPQPVAIPPQINEAFDQLLAKDDLTVREATDFLIRSYGHDEELHSVPPEERKKVIEQLFNRFSGEMGKRLAGQDLSTPEDKAPGSRSYLANYSVHAVRRDLMYAGVIPTPAAKPSRIEQIKRTLSKFRGNQQPKAPSIDKP